MPKAQEPIPVIGEFNDFLSKDLYWRIDWLDEPFKAGPNRFQPMIAVHLSPLQPNRVNQVVTHPTSALMEKQQWVVVGVGYLPLLYIGAVFKAGSPVYLDIKTSYQRRFKVLPSNFRYVGLNERKFEGEVHNSNSRAIEKVDFAIGGAWRTAKSSVVLAMSDERKIDPHFVTIPAIEIARFFFCPNSILARSLFESGWCDLIYQPKCDHTKVPKEVTVGLKQVKGLRYLDARHLAFFLTSERTKECVLQMPQFLQETDKTKRKKEPFACRFPFDEITEVTAEVVKISTRSALGFRYFVTRLLTVERPIPFEICYAYPLVHPGRGDNFDDPNLTDANFGGGKDAKQSDPSTPTGRSLIIENIEALLKEGTISDEHGNAADVNQIARFSAVEDRFPNLKHVTTTLAPKAVQEYRNAGGTKAIPITGKGLSTSTPRGSKPIAPADIDTNPSEFRNQKESTEPTVSDPYFNLLLGTVPILCQQRINASELPLINLSYCKAAPRRNRTWSRIPHPHFDGSIRYRSRMLGAICIDTAAQKIVVAEIERRQQDKGASIAAFILETSRDANEFLKELAEVVVGRKGWPVTRSIGSGFNSFELIGGEVMGWVQLHRGVESAQAYALKLQKRIESLH